MKRIYLDNAATTPLEPQVLEAMMPYMTEKFGNPSSVYSYGRECRLAVEMARKSVAGLLKARPAEIFFTSGGTESTNTVLYAAVHDLGCKRIITSSIEHHATLHTVEFFEKKGWIKAEYVKLNKNGHIDLSDLENKLASGNEKTLVSLMHANNEIGNITDIQQVGMLCRKYDAFYHADTVQTVGHFPFDLQNTPVDFINGSGHKFHGPKGVGILYVNERIKISPYIHGGGQERNMRAGTENLYGIVGFAKALELASKNYEKDRAYISGLKSYLKNQLQENIEGVEFNGDQEGNCLYTVLSVCFPKNEKTSMILFNLDMQHICVSGGSACSSGADAGSHVIRALRNDSDKVTVRFSFSKFNTKEEIDHVVAVLKELTQETAIA